jgi:hypothetical protein
MNVEDAKKWMVLMQVDGRAEDEVVCGRYDAGSRSVSEQEVLGRVARPRLVSGKRFATIHLSTPAYGVSQLFADKATSHQWPALADPGKPDGCSEAGCDWRRAR